MRRAPGQISGRITDPDACSINTEFAIVLTGGVNDLLRKLYPADAVACHLIWTAPFPIVDVISTGETIFNTY